MAAVDALSLRDHESGASAAKRWAAGVAFAIAVHAGAYLYLNRSPTPVGFESQAPIELDLLPPPTGAAQMDEAGADASSQATPEETPEEQPVEELEDINPEQTPPNDAAVTAEQVPPEELEEIQELPEEPAETPPVAAMEVPPDVTAAPPDVEPAVTLPPQETVTAREEEIEPPKPAPKPVAKKAEPKPDPKPRPKPEPKPERKPEARPQPTREAKPAERPAPARPAQQAGGRSGVSDNAGRAASAAAASAYDRRVHAAVLAQKNRGNTLSGSAQVSFVVSRSGAVSGVSASGPGPVAAEAAAMVRRASIPAMPAEMTGSSKRYRVRINLSPGR